MTTKELAQSFLDFRNEKNKVKTPQEEKTMSINKEKRPCESCGQVKQLGSHLGKLVCPSCSGMRGMINQRPRVVVDSLREMKGSLVQFLNAPEVAALEATFKGPLNSDDKSAPAFEDLLLLEVSDLKLILTEKNREIEELENTKRCLSEELNKVQQGLKEQALVCNNYERINNELEIKVKEISEELAEADNKNFTLKREMSNVVANVTSMDGSQCDEGEASQEIIELELEIDCLRGENMKLSDELDHHRRGLSRVIGTIGQSILEKHSKLPKTVFRELRRLAY